MMVKKDFTDKKDMSHGSVSEVPNHILANEDEIKASKKKYEDAFSREKKRLKKKKG